METRGSIVIRFEGSAGDGILSMGTFVAKTAARCGFHVCTLSSFLAEVRGGQSSFQLKLGRDELSSPGDAPDIVVGLNAKAVENQAGALVSPGLVFCPPNVAVPSAAATAAVVDYDAIATERGGGTRNKNLVAAGALMQVLGLERAAATNIVRETFAKKGESVADAAASALGAGFELALAPELDLGRWRLTPTTDLPRLLISGNEAVALGSIVGGVRFYAGYPITPASEVMEVLAKHLPEVGGRAVQAEDEISSLGMCIGAAFGGAKTLTATSGPGLSLMVELLGLASMAELPIVIVDVQRAGPSTGMPTKDGQGDLNLAIYGAHGDSPRIVLAPQSVTDCFEYTIRAVTLAHRFHIPVIVLSSQSLSHRMATVELPAFDSISLYEETLFDAHGEAPKPYRRYRATKDGDVSVRSIPGAAEGMYRTGGLEHDEAGQPCFDAERRNANVTRRRQRMNLVERFIQSSGDAERCVVGDQSFALVSWGTAAGPTREAIAHLRAERGWSVGHCCPRLLWPLPKQPLAELIASGIDTLFVCEANDSQQLAKVIAANLADELRTHGVKIVGINRDDGIPLTGADIFAMLSKRLDERGKAVAMVGE